MGCGYLREESLRKDKINLFPVKYKMLEINIIGIIIIAHLNPSLDSKGTAMGKDGPRISFKRCCSSSL